MEDCLLSGIDTQLGAPCLCDTILACCEDSLQPFPTHRRQKMLGDKNVQTSYTATSKGEGARCGSVAHDGDTA